MARRDDDDDDDPVKRSAQLSYATEKKKRILHFIEHDDESISNTSCASRNERFCEEVEMGGWEIFKTPRVDKAIEIDARVNK